MDTLRYASEIDMCALSSFISAIELAIMTCNMIKSLFEELKENGITEHFSSLLLLIVSGFQTIVNA